MNSSSINTIVMPIRLHSGARGTRIVRNNDNTTYINVNIRISLPDILLGTAEDIVYIY